LKAHNEVLNLESNLKIAADIRKRSTIEKTVIFNLVQAAIGSGDLYLGGNRLDDLLNTGIVRFVFCIPPPQFTSLHDQIVISKR